MVRSLSKARDPETRSHSSNVAELATSLGKALGLSDGRIDALGLCALVHYVGKIGVQDGILLKTGYLDDIAGDAIPIKARILAVCDAFDTVTTGRPYAPAMSIEATLDEIANGAGTQFDPAVAAAFGRMVRRLCAPGVTVSDPARAPA